MKIALDKLGRRFNREWIFKNIDYTFEQGQSYAILGINGSGKSTLLQVLSGALTPSSGSLTYTLNNQNVDAEDIYKHLIIAAPYLELIEEFTLLEVLNFHFQFKNRKQNLDNSALVKLLGMEASQNKQLKYFSSGMKQRVKLILAFCSDVPILMLDEPTSNLDEQGINWYSQLIQDFTKNQLLIICSNQQHEYQSCLHQLHIKDYK
jgi:ABC-type multidrug transport system ATPase subunit